MSDNFVISGAMCGCPCGGARRVGNVSNAIFDRLSLIRGMARTVPACVLIYFPLSAGQASTSSDQG